MTPRPSQMRIKGGRREVFLGMTALAILGSVGTLGYMLIEGWNLVDSFYMTFITLTTIGFSEVRPLSPSGKFFTVALATVGIGTFATIASRAVQFLISPSLRKRFMQRRLDRMKDHYIICGYGRIGQHIARDFQAAGREFVVIDNDEDRAAQLEALGLPFVHDDAEEEQALRAAGIERAAGLVLVLPQDAANVFVALTARELRERDLFIVSRTNETTAINKLRRAGADKVISPIEIGADRIAQTILRPRVDRFMEQVLGVASLDLDLEEVTITKGSLLDGHSLRDIDFRRRYDAIVVAVLKDETGDFAFNPDATVPLAAGDTLIVLASQDQLGKIQEGSHQPASGASVR
ncbi:MAG: potassium channel protein [Rubricoccaceae bacterium]